MNVSNGIFSITAAVAISFLIALPAAAGSSKVTVRQGRSIVVGALFVRAGSSCSISEPIKVHVSSPPKHGTYQVSTYKAAATEGICKGKNVPWKVVIYTAKSGYTGPDKMVFSMVHDKYAELKLQKRHDSSVDILITR